jgi:uncharacterized protein (DUF1810 family)
VPQVFGRFNMIKVCSALTLLHRQGDGKVVMSGGILKEAS